MRRVVRFITALVVVAGVITVSAPTTYAMSSARSELAAMALRCDGQAQRDVHADLIVIRRLYERVGVRAHTVTSVIDFESAASALSSSQQPASGDFAVYAAPVAFTQPSAIQPVVDGYSRIGLFVSRDYVLIYNPATRRMEIRREVDVAGVAAQLSDGTPFARAGSFHVLRLPPSAWPGGRDDVSVAPGRISLTDPARVADDLAWTAAHPRDIDTSWAHQVGRLLGLLAAPLMFVAGGVLALAALVVRALGVEGVVALALLGVVRWLLTLSFDGSGLHTFLSVAALLVLGLLCPQLVVPGLLLTAIGVVAIKANVPLLAPLFRTAGSVAWGGIGLLVTLVTGVEASRATSVFAVLMAAACAPLTWAKPLVALAPLRFLARTPIAIPFRALTALLERGAPVLIAERGGLATVSNVADAMALRPRAIRSLVVDTAEYFHIPTEDLGSAATRTAAQGRKALSWRAADGVSLLWRPRSVWSDMIGHTADALKDVDASMRAGMHGWPLQSLRPRLLALSAPWRRHLLDVLAFFSRRGVPVTSAANDLARAHSAALSIHSAASGQFPTQGVVVHLPRPAPLSSPPPTPPPPPSPAPQPAA